MTARRTAPELALHVVQQLWLGGVRDVVLAPGSRSAPLALALDAADRNGDLRLHVRIDERSAGFLALGLATGSRRPVAVVTTSGTAVGNVLPAVMEAHHTGRRLVVMSADRPDRLRGTGANQTTDQAGIFGTFAPCHDVTAATPDGEIDALVAQACSRQGPTQVNVQLDGDLLPSDPDRDTWWQRPEARPGDRIDPATAGLRGPEGPGHRIDPATAGVRGFDDPGPDPSVTVPTDGELLPLGPRTVVVAGDDAGPRRACSPRPPTGRCWPSRRPARGSGGRHCAPVGCC